MKVSTYCLQLPGDSITARRLFDAICAGCVPVVITGVGRKPKHRHTGGPMFGHGAENVEFRRNATFRSLPFSVRSGFATQSLPHCSASSAQWAAVRLHGECIHAQQCVFVCVGLCACVCVRACACCMLVGLGTGVPVAPRTFTGDLSGPRTHARPRAERGAVRRLCHFLGRRALGKPHERAGSRHHQHARPSVERFVMTEGHSVAGVPCLSPRLPLLGRPSEAPVR